jgi:hypothetical protein
MSEDGTKRILNEYAKRHTNIKIINNPSKITPKAFNIGVKNSRGGIITIISAHSIYSRNYISKCIEYLNKTGADNVGGVCEHIGNGLMGQAIALVLGCKFGLGGAKFRTAKKAQYVDTVFPGSWRREMFEKYGYFNEKLMRNQDNEYNARIRKGGGKIFLTPEIKSYYYCRSNLKDLWIQHFRTGLWNIKTIIIAPGSLSLRHFVPLFFVLGLLTTWPIFVLWLSIVMSYIFCNIFFSLKIALKNGFRYLFVMPIIFLTLHLSYGLGSLVGILAYIIKIK